jgi:hypothetical protein
MKSRLISDQAAFSLSERRLRAQSHNSNYLDTDPAGRLISALSPKKKQPEGCLLLAVGFRATEGEQREPMVKPCSA